MTVLYQAAATAKGGRNGHVRSDNGILDLQVRMPKALGGANDDFANSACFDSALSRVIRMEKVQTGETTVTAHVGIGPNAEGGFGLAVELEVNVPGVDAETAQALVAKAHQVCPYSNATRGNIEVKLTVTNH